MISYAQFLLNYSRYASNNKWFIVIQIRVLFLFCIFVLILLILLTYFTPRPDAHALGMRLWCGNFHDHWWTALTKPRLIFPCKLISRRTYLFSYQFPKINKCCKKKSKILYSNCCHLCAVTHWNKKSKTTQTNVWNMYLYTTHLTK